MANIAAQIPMVRIYTTKPAKRLLHHFAVSLEMNKLTREGTGG